MSPLTHCRKCCGMFYCQRVSTWLTSCDGREVSAASSLPHVKPENCRLPHVSADTLTSQNNMPADFTGLCPRHQRERHGDLGALIFIGRCRRPRACRLLTNSSAKCCRSRVVRTMADNGMQVQVDVFEFLLRNHRDDQMAPARCKSLPDENTELWKNKSQAFQGEKEKNYIQTYT